MKLELCTEVKEFVASVVPDFLQSTGAYTKTKIPGLLYSTLNYHRVNSLLSGFLLYFFYSDGKMAGN